MLPQALQNVIDALGQLPGIGPRSAERFAYFLFKTDPSVAQNIAKTLADLHLKVKTCPKTFALINAEDDFSPLYIDPARDHSVVLVVEAPLDIYAIEQTGRFTGTYHVLGGALSPLDDITPEKLHIQELIDRISTDKVKEVIIATNPSVEGESTALLLQQLLSKLSPSPKLTRLARGLPLGVDLSFADQITLAAALENRTKL